METDKQISAVPDAQGLELADPRAARTVRLSRLGAGVRVAAFNSSL